MRTPGKRRGRPLIRVLIHGVAAAVFLSGTVAGGTSLDPLDSSTEPGDLQALLGYRYDRWEEDRSGILGNPIVQENVTAAASMALGRAARFQFSSGWSKSEWEEYAGFEGATDTRLSLAVRPGRHALLRFGINLPTGDGNLSLEEAVLSGQLANDLKGYPLSLPGEGLDLYFGAGYAAATGPLAFAVGIGYLMKGDYETLGDSNFEPADERTIAAGLDIGSADFLWRTNVVVNLYGTDRLDGESLPDLSDQLQVESFFQETWRRGSWKLRGRAHVRDDTPSNADDTIIDILKDEEHRLEVYLDGHLETSLGGRMGLILLGGARAFDDDGNDAWEERRFDAGGGLTFDLGGGFHATGIGEYGFGRIALPSQSGEESLESDLEGAIFNVTLHYSR